MYISIINDSTMKTALTYDDILLTPSFSKVKSRNDISLKTMVSRRYGLLNPFVASPMDTICEVDMAYKMYLLGGVGCIHRFMTAEEQSNQVDELINLILGKDKFNYGIADIWMKEIGFNPIMAAIGVQEEDKKRAWSLVKAGANILVIDVAHGHHENVINMVKWCKDTLPKGIDIIAGNIVTADAAMELESAGADGLRVGLGGGSLCTTRIQTGFGVPNVTALEEIIAVAKTPVMADGGIRTSGDICKALAIGASSVMLGSLLAGTEETPGKIIQDHQSGALYKRYRGSASLETKITHNKEERNVEGESTVVPFKGGVRFTIDGLVDGIKSGLSYNGASNLTEFHPTYVIVTNAGLQESKPHLMK